MRILLALIGINFVGCSPQIRVYHQADTGSPVAQYQAFQWGKADSTAWHLNSLYFNDLNDRRIKQSVNDLLIAKGYVLSQCPIDLILRYDIRVDEQSMLLPDPYGYLYGDYWMVPRDNLFRYREVTLIIDVWQSLTKKLIWRGWAVAAIEVVFDGQKDPEVVIRSAVAKILDALPAHVSQRDTAMSVSVSGYTEGQSMNLCTFDGAAYQSWAKQTR